MFEVCDETHFDEQRERIANILPIAVNYLQAFLHDEQAVLLFDKNVTKHFEYDEINAHKLGIYSLRKSIEDGPLNQGLTIRAVLSNEGDFYMMRDDYFNAHLQLPHQIVAFQPKDISRIERHYMVGCDHKMVDDKTDNELAKIMLHEIAHAIQRGNDAHLWREKKFISDEELDAFNLKRRRNEELFCDAVADFAMPHLPMIKLRMEKHYDDRLRSCYEKTDDWDALENPKGDDQQELVFLRSNKNLFVKADGILEKENTLKFDKNKHDHPALATFRKVSEFYLPLLNSPEQNYLSSLYDVECRLG